MDGEAVKSVAAKNFFTEDNVSYPNPKEKKNSSKVELEEQSVVKSKRGTNDSDVKIDFNLARVKEEFPNEDPKKSNDPEIEILYMKMDFNLDKVKSELPCDNSMKSTSSELENVCSNSNNINPFKIPAIPPKRMKSKKILADNSSKSDKPGHSSSNRNSNAKKVNITPVRDMVQIKTENSNEFAKYIRDSTKMYVGKSRCIYREDESMEEAIRKENICRIPRHTISNFQAHTNVITSLSWCIPKHSYLFLSASLDGIVKVWDIVKKSAVKTIPNSSGLKAAKWSLDGEQIVTGGFGKKAHVYDVQTGREITNYDVYNSVTSLEFHPYIEDLFLCGTRNAIFGFDLRVDTIYPVRTFFSKCDEVLDIAFIDEREFICSSSIASEDSSDRTIMVWDFHSGSLMSKRIYLEKFTCPSLKVHPNLPTFGAQTNDDYIALFSTRRPYRMKSQKYVGHKVAGCEIEFDFSADGKYVASGDADGGLYFYNYSDSNTVYQATASKQKSAVNRVKWHPVFSSTIITATWNGFIQIWK